MKNYARIILAFSIWIPICAAVPLSTICVARNNTIDASFQPCRTAEFTLPGPKDVLNVNFTFGTEVDVTVTFTVRAVVGTVQITFSSDGQDVTDDTLDGPAVVKLAPFDLPSTDWTLAIENYYGTPSKVTLQVAVEKITTVANNATKAAITSIYKECCNDDLLLSGSSPGPCDYLQLWVTANATTPWNDVCQDSRTFCTPQGVLQKLSLRGSLERTDNNALTFLPAFNQQCVLKPPVGLANLVELQTLEILGLGLQWTLQEVANITSKMMNLEALYLGMNQISGQLNETACALFQNKPNLTTLSLRNAINVVPPWNTISGSIHNCVFDSPLQDLNLVLNQISGIDPIPAGNSPMRNLRLMAQTDPVTGVSPMAGKGWPQGLSNLPNLAMLGLGSNQLGGPLALEVPPSMEWLDVSDNSLSGSIPEINANKLLSVFIVHDNPQLQADISQIGLTNAPNLVVLDLSNTSISGNMGNVNWQMLPVLSILHMAATQLEGSIASSLASLPSLEILDLSDNPGITSQEAFGAALPPNTNITYYDVSNCRITDLPDGLRNLGFETGAMLRYWVFNISRNRIDTVMPEWLAQPIQPALGVLDYRFSIQTPLDASSSGNRIGCPSQPFNSATVDNAMNLQMMLQSYYDDNVNCYNGTELVPVANYLYWLSANGAMPAPPPPSTSAQAGAARTSAKNGSGLAKKSEHLSTSVIAAVVIGVALGVGLLVLLGFVVVRVVVPRVRSRSTFTKFKENEAPFPPAPYVDPNSFQMAVQGPNSV